MKSKFSIPIIVMMNFRCPKPVKCNNCQHINAAVNFLGRLYVWRMEICRLSATIALVKQ